MILVGGGWDSTIVENYLGIGVAALQRGYHVLLHDGPGQGELLIDEGLPLRHDWEKVITPVVDAALAIDVVDPDRIVYEPWSLGGYMAPRAAAFEHRLAAIVADPGQIDVGGKFKAPVRDARARATRPSPGCPQLDPTDEQKIMAVIDGNRSLHWKIVQRGFWTNARLRPVVVDRRDGQVEARPGDRRPDPLPHARHARPRDMASSNAQELYDALTCPKTLHALHRRRRRRRRTARCSTARMANRKILDWLDETLH